MGHKRPACTRKLVTCFACDRQGHRAVYCKRNRALPQQGIDGVAGSEQGPSHQSHPLPALITDKGRWCHNCGKHGHMRRECSRKTVKCYNYGRPCHRTVFCRQGGALSQPGSLSDRVAGGGRRSPQQQQRQQSGPTRGAERLMGFE